MLHSIIIEVVTVIYHVTVRFIDFCRRLCRVCDCVDESLPYKSEPGHEQLIARTLGVLMTMSVVRTHLLV